MIGLREPISSLDQCHTDLMHDKIKHPFRWAHGLFYVLVHWKHISYDTSNITTKTLLGLITHTTVSFYTLFCYSHPGYLFWSFVFVMSSIYVHWERVSQRDKKEENPQPWKGQHTDNSAAILHYIILYKRIAFLSLIDFSVLPSIDPISIGIITSDSNLFAAIMRLPFFSKSFQCLKSVLCM